MAVVLNLTHWTELVCHWHVCSGTFTTNTCSRMAHCCAVLLVAKWAKASTSQMSLDGSLDKHLVHFLLFSNFICISFKLVLMMCVSVHKTIIYVKFYWIIKTSCISLFEVWSVTITTDAPGVTLAGHSRASKLQAGSADPPVSARQGASVPIKLLHSSQSSSFAAASTLRCTSSTDRTSTSSQHLRSAGICCCWSDDV